LLKALSSSPHIWVYFLWWNPLYEFILIFLYTTMYIIHRPNVRSIWMLVYTLQNYTSFSFCFCYCCCCSSPSFLSQQFFFRFDSYDFAPSIWWIIISHYISYWLHMITYFMVSKIYVTVGYFFFSSSSSFLYLYAFWMYIISFICDWTERNLCVIFNFFSELDD